MAWHPPVFPPPNPFSHENIPASAWVTPLPIFLNSPQQFPSASPAPFTHPPSAADEGLLGGIPKLLAASAPPDPFSTPGSWGLAGALDTTFTPDLRPFLSSDPSRGLGSPLGQLRSDWPNRSDPTAIGPDGGVANEVPDLGASTDQESVHPRALLVCEKEEDGHQPKVFDPTEPGGLPQHWLGDLRKEPPHLPMILPLFSRGTTPPTSAPQLAPRPSLSPPVSNQPGALPPPAPGPTANSPRPSVPSVGPARVPASGEKSEGEVGDRGSADPAARGVSSPAPIGQGDGPPASAFPNWPKLVGEIKDALPFGPEKIQAVISAGLPKYDNETTYGVLITNEGQT
jgi:hypothetical protein